MNVQEETYLKGQILTRGVIFSKSALAYAKNNNAKRQNLVYNAPLGYTLERPQELLIRHADGYETVVSCVAPCKKNNVYVDVIDNRLVASISDRIIENVSLSFVEEPDYYHKRLPDGTELKTLVSACGYDELNILPWKGCAISKGCLFCGVNVVSVENANDITAARISCPGGWDSVRQGYIDNLCAAIRIAAQSECYKQHMHVIIISGDLKNDALDLQTDIYAFISSRIKEIVDSKATEGIVAVLMPPNDSSKLRSLKNAGITNVVFNLEVGDKELFKKYCPGKEDIGYDHIMYSLYQATEIWGRGHSWSNFVLGLEPIDGLLRINDELAKDGVISSANILHLDVGNRLDCDVPDYDTVINYFYGLSCILKEYDYKPYYCSKALRTSLSNEAYDGRIVL